MVTKLWWCGATAVMEMVFARKWCYCEIFEGGEVAAMATVVAFVNGAGMEVLLMVVSDKKVMLLLDSRKDVGGGHRKQFSLMMTTQWLPARSVNGREWWPAVSMVMVGEEEN
ncbi:hypothetical protein DEO72_LG1g2105 [Vigna unguiculata]|uniref:Uncharacterized protein n=1 Tax=Vigna unguiculata TaxID=3917 RepID=A0A4D6KLU0_VIGUN|nr:hypothetical protein DEO72_LG1g2105 [Vigna unguiculata]